MRAAAALLFVLAAAGCATAPPAPADAGVRIEGNSEIGTAELLGLASGELRSFTDRGRRAADLADAAYAMERGLHEMGRAHATVSFTAEPSEDQPDRVVFHVEEGPRAALGEVTFPGALAFSRERLLQFFAFPRSGFLGFAAPPYRLSDVEGAVADIRQLHLLDGYADVAVGPAVETWNESRTVVDVAVPIVQGRRYVVTSVAVEGAPGPELEAQLLRRLDLTGRPWHARIADEAAATARKVLLAQGRRAATAEAHAEIDRGEKPGARIVVKVVPGPVFRLREVTITGNVRTQTSFLRDLVGLQTGDVLGQDAIDAAVNRLYGAGVLRSADVKTPGAASPAEGRSAVSDAVVAVEELDARSVEAGLGWGSYERARGHVEYRDRNLFGLARELSVRTSASLVSTGIESSLSDRYLLGKDNTLRVSAAWDRRQEPSFERRTLAGEASVRHDFREGAWVTAGYRIRAEEAQHTDGRIAGAEEKGFVRSAGLFVDAARDTRDDPLFPSSGSIAQAGLFRSSPHLGADLDFLEARLSAAKYLRLLDGTVLALGAAFTTRDPQDDRATLPIQERLFLGGADTVRSFRESELGPSNASREPVGGLTSLDAHLELRQRIRAQLECALFYDVGTIGREAWQVDGPRGHAIGLGLRYRLPVGPIRVDFGWNPGDRFAANRPWAIHLSFGFSF